MKIKTFDEFLYEGHQFLRGVGKNDGIQKNNAKVDDPFRAIDAAYDSNDLISPYEYPIPSKSETFVFDVPIVDNWERVGERKIAFNTFGDFYIFKDPYHKCMHIGGFDDFVGNVHSEFRYEDLVPESIVFSCEHIKECGAIALLMMDVDLQKYCTKKLPKDISNWTDDMYEEIHERLMDGDIDGLGRNIQFYDSFDFVISTLILDDDDAGQEIDKRPDMFLSHDMIQF